ncbi:MAG: methyltransferase domain-containing protein, partial [Bradyrhizobiaceae bacterium]|nr:methyltransferase domain-containing protein [Bradyrhizobiaceae bacterium]
LASLADRDRALVRRLVATVLRRLGTLRDTLLDVLGRGFPGDAPRIETVLLLGAAQILFLDVPDHAAVDLAVRLAQADRRSGRYAGLVNAVLRRMARHGAERLPTLDAARLDTPAWLMARWTLRYGDDIARSIAHANACEPSLDLTVKSDAETWAARLQGRVLPTGTVRTAAQGRVSMLPGFVEGAWWVQDAAAALPARLLSPVAGRRIADLCAAPGGKTAQLAWAGAKVTAVDRSESRLARLRENLHRLGLTATLVCADATEWQAEAFDAVLLDAPCSSTGTIRRHPDIPWLKSETDIAALADLQRRLLDRAVALTKPGGFLVFSTCSLEPEEGEQVVATLLDRDPRVERRPIAPDEIVGLDGLLTPGGDLRTLPCHWPDRDPQMAGLDGFYAARLQRG